MSHDATNWAIQQRGLQPATKIVLWHLCDRYHPDYGCFPTQETLASDCEMSRATVNRHIEKLEAAGLLRRVKRFDKATNRQKSTLYILGFEARFPQDVDGAVSQIDTRKSTKAVSQNEQKPCLILDESRVSNCDTNTVIVTSNRTSKKARDGAPKPTPRSELEKVLTSEMAEEVIQHRNRIRKPMTALAASLLAEEFAKVDNPNHGATIMIKNGWQGFKPSWYENAVKSEKTDQRSQKAKTVSEVFGQLADQMERQAS